ncbi:MAG: hypothetical protein IKV94_03205 [Clostridia bacterium]|nr:hypothetical protein [Clostridia bacterium]
MKKGNAGVIVLITLLFVTVIALAVALLYFNKEEAPLNNEGQSNNNSGLIENENESTIDNSQQNKDNEDKIDNSQQNTIQSLKTDDALVVKLYRYILKQNFYGEKVVYQTQKITNKNLANEIKLLTIFENLELSDAQKVKTDVPGVRVDADGNAYKYVYSKAMVEKKAKELFGKDVALVHEDCFVNNSYKLEYTNGQYEGYLLSAGSGPSSAENSYRELIKAEKDNNNIYIYDKYLHVVKEDVAVFGIYTASDRKVKIGTVQGFEGIEANKNKASEFKHTFTKNEDGNYYWVSTEIIKSSSANTIQNLKTDDNLVIKLYNYILKLNINGEKQVYQSQKVTNKNVDNEIKLLTIFENLELSDAQKVKTDEPAVRVDADGNAYKYVYSKELVMNKAKEIFGEDVTLVHKGFFIGNSNKVVYSDGQYSSYMLSTGSGPVAWENSYHEIVKAEKDNDNIYIYDKYLHVVRNNENNTYNIYSSSDRIGLIAEGVSLDKINSYKNEAKTYKHTFTKNKDGNYYWVSTEMM